MRSTCSALICALAVVASQSAQSLGDDLDDLLASPPAAVSFEPASAPDSEAADPFSISEDDAASYSDQSRWRPAIGLSTHPVAKTKTSEAHKTAPGDLSLVPEPSGVVLAGLALVYFLVFGRRRVFS